MFADVSGRRDRFALYKLISQGAGFELKDMVIENPELIGQTREIWLLADDEIDVYLKGNVTKVNEMELSGKPYASGDTGVIQITGDGEVFTPVIEKMQELFSDEQTRVEKELEGERVRLEKLNSDLVNSRELLAEAEKYNYPTRIERYKEIISNIEGEISDTQFKIETLEARIAGYRDSLKGTTSGLVKVPTDAASYLLELNGGLARITALSSTMAEAQVINTLKPSSGNGEWKLVIHETPESERRVNDRTIGWVRQLQQKELVDKKFNTVFFSHGDSR